MRGSRLSKGRANQGMFLLRRLSRSIPTAGATSFGIVIAVLVTGWISASSAEVAIGKAESTVMVQGYELTIYTYKPEGASAGPLILGFHGSDRQAALVRDFLMPLANQIGAIVVAPLLDEPRFPRWRYQWAGLLEPVEAGPTNRYRPSKELRWTSGLLLALIDHMRNGEGRPEMEFYLIGHSAGAQFLGRLSPFTVHGAKRIVLANAGSYLAPERDWGFPYGFDGLPEKLKSDVVLRRYLALPLTIYLGTEDRRRTKLDRSEGAERQGANRLERGHAIFRMAQEIAQVNGWPFEWQLQEVRGVGHNSKRMYAAPEMLEAMFGPSPSGKEHSRSLRESATAAR